MFWITSVNEHRRKFLKIVLIGSSSFIVGKILGPVISKFVENMDTGMFDNLGHVDYTSPRLAGRNNKQSGQPSRLLSSGFRVNEDQSILSVFDDTGEEIFQIDKRA